MSARSIFSIKAVFFLTLLNAFVINASAQSQKVILLGFYGGSYNDGTTINSNTLGVPCPLDPISLPATNTWFYDQLAKEANTIANSGFTAIWLPPMSKGALGATGSGSNIKYYAGGIYDPGYGVFDHYDLGDKLQSGNYQTRYGSRTQLTRCIAMLRANGIDAYNDFVTNQVTILANVTPTATNNYLWYQYKDAYGNPTGGRFPKYTTDFHNPPSGKPGSPGGAQDPDVPATTYPDGTSTGQTEGYFGPDFAHITGQQNVYGLPGVYCADQLGLWGDWLIRATGIQGYRIDDASGISWDFLKRFVNYGAMQGKFSVTELAGSPFNLVQLKTWMQSSMGQTGDNFTMFDQVLQGGLSALCKTDKFYIPAFQSKFLSYGSTNAINPSAGTANPGSLDIYRSLMATDPAQSVTVVNEIDSETGTNPVLPKQCLIGYTYIMTIGSGIPCVPYRDWSTDAGSYGSIMIDANNLNYHLNKLIWCHNFVCTGGLTNEYAPGDGHIYSFQRTGGKQAMVIMNSNQTDPETVFVPTSIPDGTVLSDYTDHNVTATVAGGHLSVTVPANINGRGYLVMAPTGITGSFAAKATSVTQEWDASTDLSIPPASSNAQEVCRIWVDNNQTISTALLNYNITNWTSATNLTVEIDQSSLDNKTNVPLTSRTFNSSQQNQSLTYATGPSGGPGYYSIWVTGNALPDNKTNWWFNLQNTYTASQTAPADFNDTVPALTSAVKPLSIPTSGSNNLQLFPNPAHDSITAQYMLAYNTTLNLKVYNSWGKVVYSPGQLYLPAGAHSNTMNISGLDNGIYLLQLETTGGQVFAKEFIKQ